MSYHVLCLDDDAIFLKAVSSYLKRQYKVSTAENVLEAEIVLAQGDVDLLLLDVQLGDENGVDVLKAFKQKHPSLDVLMFSGHKDPKQIVEAMKYGASDYLTKDTYPDEVIAYIDKILKNKDIKDRYRALIENINESKTKQHAFVGSSRNFRDVLEKASRLKGYMANVLIEGDSGTGKEVLARYIHSNEGLQGRPFIAVNCAAIPDNIMESELFGHEKGSFTGALHRKVGKLELADGGDVFLDEISSLKLELQGKLLRALEQQEFYRVGGVKSLSVNFRVVAATNVRLIDLVRAGKFREDLYHRLNVINLILPPLKERKSDIKKLLEHFFHKYCDRYKKIKLKGFTQRAIDVLSDYVWPGNVRELKNMVQSLIIMSDGAYIDIYDLPKIVLGADHACGQSVRIIKNDDFENFLINPQLTLTAFRYKMEQQYVKSVIASQHGNKSKAAELLGISRVTLHGMLKKDPSLSLN
ncbi:MAG: sigma-54 dependent transcriptional regulator [bacterium]|nr:sigma-54 dependent transcriptional regulator [bacterium]MBU1916916.1 sigma-54 dependent transcriptional regulator [bacterium]